MLHSTIVSRTYRECGSVLYESGAYLLEGRFEQDPHRGFSFVAESLFDLLEMLERARTRGGRARGSA